METKKLVLKVAYIDFIEKVAKAKTQSEDAIAKLYTETYKKRWSNVKRVIQRSNRKGVKELKLAELEKRGVKKADVEKVEAQILSFTSASSNNFVIEV